MQKLIRLVGLVVLFVLGCEDTSNNPSLNDAIIAYADSNWTYYEQSGGDFDAYLNYEYWAAANFGPDGESGGEVYTGSIDMWQELTWTEKLEWLPSNGFPCELNLENKDTEYFRNIGLYNQFGAGWPADGDHIGAYRANKTVGDGWGWLTGNSYRDEFCTILLQAGIIDSTEIE